MKPSRFNSGFSLIEVLCAILILGVGLVGLVQGVTTALSSSKDSELHTTAALLAAGQMELLRADGFLIAGSKEGECGEAFSRFRWRQTIARARLDGLYEVTIAIEQAKDGKALFELKTMLFDPPLSSSAETRDGSDSQRSRKRERNRR